MRNIFFQVEALNSRKVSLPEIQVQAPTGWRIEDSAAGKIFVSCATNEKVSRDLALFICVCVCLKGHYIDGCYNLVLKP